MHDTVRCLVLILSLNVFAALKGTHSHIFISLENGLTL